MIQRWKLKKCRSLRQEAETYNERLLAMQPSVSSKLDAMPRGTQIGRPTEESAINLISLEELMTQIVQEYNKLKTEIVTAASVLPSLQRQIIIYRYIDADTWEEIGEITRYSISWVKAQHDKAIKKICY